MSGHSKWSSIKHKKALTDAKKGQQFTKMAREITIAAREGGGNPDGNYRLRLAIEKARDVNMPQDNVQRAIKRGTGELGGAALEELRFEGYGVDSAEVTMNASQLVPLNEATAPSVLKLLDALEEHDDVQSVYSNMDVPADVLERISERV